MLLSLLLFIIVLTALAYHVMFVAPTQLEINEKELWLPDLPPELEGLRLLHLSDWHLVEWDVRTARFFESLASLEADLVLHTGDFIETDHGIERCHEFLGRYRGRYGQFGVLGNHDYYRFPFYNVFMNRKRTEQRNDIDLLVEVLADLNISVLRNTHASVEINGCSVTILGLDDNVTLHEDIPSATADLPPADFTICLAHSPDILHPDYPHRFSADLVLFGHTHGGQFRLPVIGPITTACELTRDRCAGVMMADERTAVHITRGLGSNRHAPGRLLCPPEATMLVLRRGPSKSPSLRWRAGSRVTVGPI